MKIIKKNIDPTTHIHNTPCLKKVSHLMCDNNLGNMNRFLLSSVDS